MAKVPTVWEFMLWQGFDGFSLSPRGVRGRLVGQHPLLHDVLEKFFGEVPDERPLRRNEWGGYPFLPDISKAKFVHARLTIQTW